MAQEAGAGIRWLSSPASGGGSGASASAGRPPTSRCCASSASRTGAGWPGASSRTASRPCNLLPGPASTQLAIYCAWRLRGTAGALVAGSCFIVPGLVVILALAALFLAARPPGWVSGAALGAGAAVPAVAAGRRRNADPGELAAGGRRRGRAGSRRAGSRRAGSRPLAAAGCAGAPDYLAGPGGAAAAHPLGPWLRARRCSAALRPDAQVAVGRASAWPHASRASRPAGSLAVTTAGVRGRRRGRARGWPLWPGSPSRWARSPTAGVS